MQTLSIRHPWVHSPMQQTIRKERVLCAHIIYTCNTPSVCTCTIQQTIRTRRVHAPIQQTIRTRRVHAPIQQTIRTRRVHAPIQQTIRNRGVHAAIQTLHAIRFSSPTADNSVRSRRSHATIQTLQTIRYRWVHAPIQTIQTIRHRCVSLHIPTYTYSDRDKQQHRQLPTVGDTSRYQISINVLIFITNVSRSFQITNMVRWWWWCHWWCTLV